MQTQDSKDRNREIDRLARGYQLGKERDFDELYSTFIRPYLKVCRSKCGSTGLTEETLEDVSTIAVVKAIRTWRISKRGSFKTWLVMCFRQAISNQQTKEHKPCRWPKALPLDEYEADHGEIASKTLDPAQEASWREYAQVQSHR